MKANVESLEGNKVKLLIELDNEEVDEALEQAFKKISRQINVPGFRPGKAPRRLIEARVGAEAARAQALNDSLPDHYMAALRQTETDAIAAPEIEITSGESEGPVLFEAVVEVRPVPTLAGHEGLQVTVPNPEPLDEDVDKQIERMRVQYGELEPIDGPAGSGHFVTIDVTGEHEGEPVAGLTASDYSYEVGSGLQSLGADFDAQIAGSRSGDVKEFVSPVPPNDQEVSFRVEVKAVNERKLPEIDDEWANEVSEFESIDELRADIAKRLREVRKGEAAQALRSGVVEAISAFVEDDVPESLIDSEMQRQLREVTFRLQQQGLDLVRYLEATGQPQEVFVSQMREGAVSAVKADLALRALADKEGIEATEDELDAEIEALARQFNQKPAKVRRDLERGDQLAAVRSDIRKAKAVRWLMENVEVVDTNGVIVDRSLLMFDDESDRGQHDHSEGEDEV